MKGQMHLIQPNSWTVTRPHGAPSQMQPSLEVLKTSGCILGRCFLRSQGSVDLRSLRLLNLCKCLGATWFTLWLAKHRMGPCILPERHFPRDRKREGKNPFYSLLFMKRDIWGDYIRVFKVILWNKSQSSIQLVTDDRWGTEIREAYFSFQVSSSESFRTQEARIPGSIDYWLGRLSSGVPQ